MILAVILYFNEKAKKRKKNYQAIPKGQYAYCKYLEIL